MGGALAVAGDQLRTLGLTGPVSRLERLRASMAALSTGASSSRNPAMPSRLRSRLTEKIDRPQIHCHVGYTNEETRRILREAIPRSPLYSGQIAGIGPRYCPSIEDKIVKFPDKPRPPVVPGTRRPRHQRVYVNGMSTSMPIDVQAAVVASIPGLERAEMIVRLRYRIRLHRPAGTRS